MTVIEGDGSTNYSAYAPDLPGVVVTGDSLRAVWRAGGTADPP